MLLLHIAQWLEKETVGENFKWKCNYVELKNLAKEGMKWKL